MAKKAAASGTTKKKRKGPPRKTKDPDSSGNGKDPEPHPRVVAALPELEGPTFDPEGAKCLHKYDMALLELAQEKVKVSAQDVALIEREVGRLQLEYELKVAKQAEKLTKMRAAMSAPAQHLLALRRLIGEVYGVNLDQVSYDDVSGKLYVTTANSAGPVS